jgi:Flp pilus assembly protein TadD
MPPTPDALGAALRHHDAGDLVRAEQACLQAVQTGPHQAQALHLLGIIRHQLGRHEEALAHLRQAARIDPANPALHSNLGMVCAAAGRLAEAEQHYREALRLAPTHAEAHNNLGILLAELGRLAEAAGHYQEALRLRPDDSAAHNNLAGVLLEQGRLAEAEQHYREALRLRPDYLAARTNLAALFVQRGRLAEAVTCCQEALRLAPGSVAAYAHLGDLASQGLYDFTEDQVGRMEGLLSEGRLSPEEASQLHFILAALRDRQGEADGAFAHYRQANDLKAQVFRRKGQAFDPEGHRRLIDDLIATFDRAFFERVGPLGLSTELPVFVVGMPRTGTTLVAQVLSSHPQVVAAGELRDLQEALYQVPAERGRGPYPRGLAGLDRELAHAVGERYLARLSHLGGGAARVVDKMPHNFLHLGATFALFPRARIIHCRRGPRDTCLSCYFQNFAWVNYATSLEHLGFYYREYERLIRHWQEALPAQVFEVNYEELVRNQERVSRELVAFCGLDWSDRCLAFHENSRTVQTASKLQVRRPIYASSLGRWKRYERHLQPLERALALPCAPGAVGEGVVSFAGPPGETSLLDELFSTWPPSGA